MLLTRWKLMAGVLGVSIGGLAAAASQCPKLDKSKGRQPEAPVTAEAPKLPPAGAPSAPKLPDLPTAPQLTPAGISPPAPAGEKVVLPPAPAAAPGLPSLPDFPSPTTEPKAAKPEEKAPPAALTLPIPDAKPALEPTKTTTPAPATPPMLPPKPVAEAPKAVPAVDLLPAPVKTAPVESLPPVTKPVSTPPVVDLAPPVTTAATPTKPMAQPVMPISGTQPPALPGTAIESPKPLPAEPTPALEVPASKPTPAPSTDAGTVKVGAMKYRIVLRVGEGEPTFEVKSGDDLVLKVACEKVDIKSPEKGAGLSAVTARGKVRFAGFGVEGTCEELSFMAGTGEVSMAGEVKVQMKDKLGRVESELTTATLKYKIDANAVGAALKP